MMMPYRLVDLIEAHSQALARGLLKGRDFTSGSY